MSLQNRKGAEILPNRQLAVYYQLLCMILSSRYSPALREATRLRHVRTNVCHTVRSLSTYRRYTNETLITDVLTFCWAGSH